MKKYPIAPILGQFALWQVPIVGVPTTELYADDLKDVSWQDKYDVNSFHIGVSKNRTTLVSLNFFRKDTVNINEISTLVHELGHCVHLKAPGHNQSEFGQNGFLYSTVCITHGPEVAKRVMKHWDTSREFTRADGSYLAFGEMTKDQFDHYIKLEIQQSVKAGLLLPSGKPNYNAKISKGWKTV